MKKRDMSCLSLFDRPNSQLPNTRNPDGALMNPVLLLIRKKAFIIALGLMLLGGIVAAGVAQAVTSSSIHVLSQNDIFGQQTNERKFRLRIANNTSHDIDLSGKSVRYFMTDNAENTDLHTDIWWYSGGLISDIAPTLETSGIQKTLILRINKGLIHPNETAEIQLRVRRTDWSRIDQSNDWSFADNKSFAINENIQVYSSTGVLEFGKSPNGGDNDDPENPGDDPDSPPPTSQFNGAGNIDAGNFAIIALEAVRIADRVKIRGDVASLNIGEIGADASILGSVSFKQKGFLRERAYIDGEYIGLSHPTSQNSVRIIQGIRGDVTTANFDVLFNPEPPSDASGQDFALSPRGAGSITPGIYGSLNIGAGSNLIVEPGDYQFSSINIEPDVRISFNGDMNTKWISKGNVKFGDRTQFNLAGRKDPLSIAILGTGQSGLSIGTDCDLWGSFSQWNGDINVGSRVKIRGSLAGKNVNIEPDARIAYPPTLKGISHSEVAFGPIFRPLYNQYKSRIKSSLESDTIWASAKYTSSRIKVSGNNYFQFGTPVQISGTINPIEIQVTDEISESFLPGSGLTRYILTLSKSELVPIFVNGSSTCGPQCDGESWSTALPNLEKALFKARVHGRPIWLAEGSYQLPSFAGANVIRPGIKILGGFLPVDGASEDTRKGDLTKTTVLSNGISSDGTPYSLKLVSESPLPRSVIFSGLSFSGDPDNQQVSASDPMITFEKMGASMDYVKFSGEKSNSNAPMLFANKSDVRVTNSYIVDGKTNLNIPLIRFTSSRVTGENVVISKNNSVNSGLIFTENSELTLRFTTIASNTGKLFAGKNSQIRGFGCNIWGNNSETFASLASGSSMSWEYSNIEGAINQGTWNEAFGVNLGENHSTEPQFTSPDRYDDGNGGLLTVLDGLRPKSTSPMRAKVPSEKLKEGEVDILQFGRAPNATIGAYESYDLQAGDAGLGKIWKENGTTTWKAADRLYTYSGDPILAKALVGSNANYYMSLKVRPQRHVGWSLYGYVKTVDEETGEALSPETRISFRRLTNNGSRFIPNGISPLPAISENGYWNYYSIGDREILLVASKELEDPNGPIAALYAPTTKRVKVTVRIPHSQFGD